MIIGIDGNEANVENKVGVSIYVLELIHYFYTKTDSNTQYVIYLRDKPHHDFPLPNNHFQYHIVKGNFLWSQLFLPINLYLKKEIDIFFSPAHYAPRFCPVPTVVTIHDLSYFYYPNDFLRKDLYQLKNWTKYSVEKASKIIAVSKNTKKDLIKYYHVPENKIEIIYNGFNSKLKVKSKKLKIELKNKKYILYVGTIQPRKNLHTLITAFHLLLKEKPEYSLIIAGKKGWLYGKLFDHVRTLNLEDKIIFTGYISDEEKEMLYQHASFFVLPSLYEGFGIPLLEAMNYDCPVIASFTSSLPEIGGDACLYFDPNKPEELNEKMKEIIGNTPLRKELVQKGKKRVQLFSWVKCGRETLDTIRKLYER